MAKLYKPKIPVMGKTPVRKVRKKKGQSKAGTRARSRYDLKRAKYLP